MSAEDIEYMDDYKEFPTKESALDWLDYYLSLDERNNLIRVLQTSILDKIRDEIKQYQSDYDVHGTEYDRTAWKAFNRCLQIINKYMAESEK